ncbi:MAG TPA: PAS domain S-box protein [Candidatus Omnitrophota bacterium]|nr:PAS domain S-box protein [Candidatus Omnitrophota bacterium]
MLDTLEKMNKRIKNSSQELGILYEDLLEQKRFTSEILSLAPSMVLMFLPDGRIKYVNDAIEVVTGFKPEESIGRIWFDQFVPYAERLDVREVFDEILLGRIDKFRQKQSMILTKEGKERLILWNYSVLKNTSGEVTAIIGVGQDISEFKKIESELLKKMNDLERFYKVSMDREKIILSLKKQIAEMKEKLSSQAGKTDDTEG